MARRKVLFLCTGNYYRSRFAEVLFESVATKMGLAWTASSGALALELGVLNVGPMAVSAVKALETLGIRSPATSRLPLAVTAEMLSQADRIIALSEEEHLPMLQAKFPDQVAKVEFWEVADKPGIFGLIEGEVTGLVARIIGGGVRTGPPAEPTPPPKKPEPPKKVLTARVGREIAGRRGKGVTTIFDLPISEDQLKELAAILKQKCGTGGTVKDGRIEIQGDNRDRIIQELEKLGYKTKKVGG